MALVMTAWRHRSGLVALPSLAFLGVMALAGLQVTTGQSPQRMIGVQFLSFSYLKQDQLPSGSCCDGGQPVPGTGQCPADTCDTAFVFCITHRSNGSTCDPYFKTTTLENNNTVSAFGKKIDEKDLNGTFSLVVIPVNTMEDITVQVSVNEVDTQTVSPSQDVPLGNFSLVLNSTQLFSRNPDWQTRVFQNNFISLGLNLTSFCKMYYFGPSCNIFCMDRGPSVHYTCDKQGTKVCNTGYEGADCRTITDLCVSSPCRNSGSCQKQVNDFTCTCTAGFTGKTCDSSVTATNSAQPQSSATHSTTHSPSGSTGSTTADPKASKVGGSPSGGTSLGVILGPIFALLAVAVAAFLFFLWFQRKRKRTVAAEEEQLEKESTDGTENDSEAPENPAKSTAPLSTQRSAKPAFTAAEMP